MTGWIGITVGAVTGIGPEVTLKALAAETRADDTRYLVIGDVTWLKRLHAQLHCEFPLQIYPGPNRAGLVFVFDPRADPLPGALPAGAPAAACAAQIGRAHV